MRALLLVPLRSFTALVALSLLSPISPISPLERESQAADLHDFVGAAKCKSCHKKELIGKQYQAWQKGPHHHAFETLSNDASLAIARERDLEGAPSESAECLRCHVTAFGVAPARIANALAAADGVQCESCHGPGRDYRKKKIMSDPERSAAKGLWDAANDGAICESCHNPESPTYDPSRYVLSDGTTAGFDFEIAKGRVPHAIPEDVKGRYVELEKKLKEEQKAGLGD